MKKWLRQKGFSLKIGVAGWRGKGSVVRKMYEIDGKIKIDFKIPTDIQNVMDLCEDALRDGNEGLYENWVDTLDMACKEAVAQGHFTRSQWNLIMKKYNLKWKKE